MKNAKKHTMFGRCGKMISVAVALAAAATARGDYQLVDGDDATTMPTTQLSTTQMSAATQMSATTMPSAAAMILESATTMPVAAPSALRWQPAARPAAASGGGAVAAAMPTMFRSGATSPGKVTLGTSHIAELRTTGTIKRVSVGSPDIADVQPFSTNVLLITAKKPGSTQVIVTNDQDRSESMDVTVEIPLEQLRDLIAKVAPNAKIEVAVAADTIVLRGQAPNLTIAKQVGDVAGAYGKVQNMIEVAGAQTIAVQVQFAEVSRSVTSSLGVTWATQNGFSIFGSDPTSSGLIGFHAKDGVIDGFSSSEKPGNFNIFGRGSVAGNPFSYFVRALRDNSMLRVLQEPTLTTTSGEPASFLAGGQVAVPVPADNGTIGIEYKEFGVRLLLTPVALGNGKIKLIMEAESSDLDYSNGTTIQGAAVPGLRTRRVQNTIELAEGQTISVAGLLDDSVVATKQSVPGLGDIPVIGQLFRSTRYQRRETELVVLITPRLAGAMNPGQVPPLPGAQWRHPSELEQFAFGDVGGNKEADVVKDWNKPIDQRGLNAPPPASEGGLERSGRIARNDADRGHDANAPAPLFLGEHGFAPAPTPEPSLATIGKD